MKTSPTSRSLCQLKEQGAHAQVVERFCPYSKRRIDLFGVIDIVAIRCGRIVGIQTTTGSNFAARLTKMDGEPRVLEWVRAGGILECHGWSKKGARGKRKLWSCRVAQAYLLPCGTNIIWKEAL